MRRGINPDDPDFEDDTYVGCPGCAPAWVSRFRSQLCAQCQHGERDFLRRRRAADPELRDADPWAPNTIERTHRRGA